MKGRKALSKVMKKTLNNMEQGVEYSSYELGCSMSTLQAWRTGGW